MSAPIGYFVHHQGRGHAERCADVVNALPASQPVTVFCARDDIFPAFTRPVELVRLPSLFEATGQEDVADFTAQPETVHCAPLGWPGIRGAMATLTAWFARANPTLMISDVSAEVAQLARLCSVPHVMVLQHGRRGDAGHRAAYDGAAGLLCPASAALAQPDWDARMRARTHFAGGLGVATQAFGPEARDAARRRLNLAEGERMILVMSGGGGSGFASAPIAVGARALDRARWITIGRIARDWHATEPANLHHAGWVEDAPDYLAAADLVIASTGNTTCHQILAAGKPWLAIPEWRYFDEQSQKAEALDRAGVATHLTAFPASAACWRAAIDAVLRAHDPARQRALIAPDAAELTARWLMTLCAALRPAQHRPAPRTALPKEPSMSPDPQPAHPLPPREVPAPVSVLTLARGRADHLGNVMRGLMRQDHTPRELIIGYMQDAPFAELPRVPFPVRQVHVPGDQLPLARARNTVARLARGEVLVFLDVDCIPGPDVLSVYGRLARPGQGLLMGEVAYLPAGAAAGDWDIADFDAVAQRHSERPGPPEAAIARCKDYRCFWSLNFAMHRLDWDRSAGFDERFVGYGGEDTDFGRQLDRDGIALSWVRGARVYHQHHAHCMPPIHHIGAVLRNAELFAEKWGHRTMEHWLRAFRLMGLIEEREGRLVQRRAPQEADFALCRQRDDMAFASAARVLDRLERQVAVAAE